MLKNELIELIDNIIKKKAESQNLEVKSAHKGTPKRLYDTLSSFSNQDGGGLIVFGLDETDGFSPVGVYDLQDLQKKVTEQCNQMIPRVRAVFTMAEYKGVNVCCVEIPSADLSERPCYYAGAGKVKGSYVRVGDADLPMTDLEIYSHDSYRKHVHDDERVIERAKMSLLKENELERYILQMKTDRPGFSRLPENEVHEMLSLTRNGTPTLASVLNFGIYPQGLLPQLCVTAVVVPGEEIGDIDELGVRFLNNKRIEGTLNEMLDETIGFCMRNMKTQTVIHPENGKREDIPEYPINAIREAVLNALIHRDYSVHTKGTPVQICFFSNRLEIHSPGNLYGRMTIEDLGRSRQDLRNPALASMAEFLLHTENRYSGIPTIRREMKEHGLAEPLFENRRNEFVVTFFNKRSMDQTEYESTPLLEFCRTPKSRKEICDFLGIRTTAFVTKNYIQPLVNAGKLKLCIPDKPKSRYQKYYASR